ncbi:MAG: type I-E CRISPR-associated protein Cas5/CasD [Polyangiaceae bacterium]
MISVLLRLEGPLQSWGTRSRFGYRDTEREPSKSGVIGLLGAALGMTRDDDALLGKLAKGVFAVRVDREGEILTDYHSVGGGTFNGVPHLANGAKDPILTHRDYLMGASFLCAMGFEDHGLAKTVHEALGAPHWPLFLGRKACPPSLPVQVPDGTVGLVPEAALRAAPFTRPAKRAWTPNVEDAAARTRLIVECARTEEGAEPRQDQPVSFALSRRKFVQRYQRTLWIEPGDRRLEQEEAPCISLAAF